MGFYKNRICVRFNDLLVEEMFEMMDDIEVDCRTDYIRAAVIFYNKIHKYNCFDKFDSYIKKKEKKYDIEFGDKWSKKVN